MFLVFIDRISETSTFFLFYTYPDEEYQNHKKGGEKMKDFQSILEQIALEHGTTPDDVRQEMQLAIDTAFENPSEEEKSIQNMMPFQGTHPTPEELVLHIAMLLQNDNPLRNSQPPPRP